MATIMKFGGLPFAKDPKNPTLDETNAIQKRIGQYQAVFDTH
jgi:hypothetical protein